MDPRFRNSLQNQWWLQYIYQRSQSLQESSGEDAENSLNTELGFRFDKGALHGEVRVLQQFLESARFWFYVWRCAGTGDLFNAGAATVKGIELLATYDVIDNRKDSSYLLLYHILSLILNWKTTSIVRWGRKWWWNSIHRQKSIGNHRSFRNYKIQLFR
jgi:outer membrane receptor protein involved in Fe transport